MPQLLSRNHAVDFALFFLLLLSPTGCIQSREAQLIDEIMELSRQKQYEQAIPPAREVLRIREEALGPEHTSVADTLTGLAELLKASGDSAGAQPLYERAIRIYEKNPKPTRKKEVFIQPLRNAGVPSGRVFFRDPGATPANFAVALVGLGKVLEGNGDYAGAQPLYERALSTLERALGPEHLAVAACLTYLGDLYSVQRRYEEAEPFYRRAFAIREANRAKQAK